MARRPSGQADAWVGGGGLGEVGGGTGGWWVVGRGVAAVAWRGPVEVVVGCVAVVVGGSGAVWVVWGVAVGIGGVLVSTGGVWFVVRVVAVAWLGHVL